MSKKLKIKRTPSSEGAASDKSSNSRETSKKIAQEKRWEKRDHSKKERDEVIDSLTNSLKSKGYPRSAIEKLIEEFHEKRRGK